MSMRRILFLLLAICLVSGQLLIAQGKIDAELEKKMATVERAKIPVIVFYEGMPSYNQNF